MEELTKNKLTRKPRREDISGSAFHSLTVVEFSHVDKRRNACWVCKCECGRVVVVSGASLKSGHTKSCGCFAVAKSAETCRKRNTTHGKRYSGAYASWTGMLQRCLNPKNHKYKDYGARGIAICEKWKDFATFYSEMGERPDGTSIERLDVDGDYTTENCVWGTAEQQARNKRIPANCKTGVPGVYWKRASGKYQARIHSNGKRISLGYYMELEEAVKARREAEQRLWQAPAGEAYQR